MLNNITIQGRLVKNPELRRTQKGKAVTTFRLACERDYEKKADFIDVVAWDKTAEFVSKFFTKGRLIVVVGELHTREYEGENGKKILYEINADHVYFCDSAKTEQKPTNLTPVDVEYEDTDLPW